MESRIHHISRIERWRELPVRTGYAILGISLCVLLGEAALLIGMGFQPGWAFDWPFSISPHVVFASFVAGVTLLMLLTIGVGLLAPLSAHLQQFLKKDFFGWIFFAVLTILWAVPAVMFSMHAFAVVHAGSLKEWRNLRVAGVADSTGLIEEGRTMNDHVKQSHLGSAQEYLERGLKFGEEGMLDQAIADFNSAILLDPEDADIFHNRGYVFFEQKEYQSAILDFNKAISLDPKLHVSYLDLGNTFQLLGKTDDAEQVYRDALNALPDWAIFYYNLGALYLNRGDQQLALKEFSLAIADEPNYLPPYKGRAQTYHELGQYENAIRDWNRCIEEYPDVGTLYFYRGRAHFALNDLQSAMNDLNEAVRIQNDDPDCIRFRAEIYSSLGMREKATADLNQAALLEKQEKKTTDNSTEF